MIERKIKLGFLISDIAYGGAAKSVYLLLKNIDKSKFEIYLFTNSINNKLFLKDFERESTVLNKVDLPTLHYHITSKTVYKSFQKELQSKQENIKNFVEFIKTYKLDILHINTTLFAYLLPEIKKLTNLKIVYHIRELLIEDHSLQSKTIINNIKLYADRIIAISENEAEVFSTCEKMRVIANPYEFKDEFRRNNSNSKNDKIRIGMFGNFKKGRNHLLLLRSLKYLVKINKKYKFIFVGIRKKRNIILMWIKKLLGRGDLDLKFYRCIKKHNLKPYVELYPNTPNIQEHLNSIDIYVRPDGLPWGRDIIEAMANKIPVVATGTSQFYVKNKVTGLLAKPDDHIDLADKIIELAENANTRKVYAEKGYEIIKEMCDSNKHAKMIENIYESLLGKN